MAVSTSRTIDVSELDDRIELAVLAFDVLEVNDVLEEGGARFSSPSEYKFSTAGEGNPT